MEMKIGAKLAALRKERGLTQEQLAGKLGISAPAVSKWETDTSYPDITLLCPLARALDTNVDTLLQFEAAISDADAMEKLNRLVEAALSGGWEAAEKSVEELLHTYPNSAALKFNSTMFYDVLFSFSPTVGEEKRKQWTARKKELLTDLRSSGSAAYHDTATLQLAIIALSENELDTAEQLLNELPERTTDPTFARSLLFRRKKQPEEALKTLQKRLFSLVRQSQTCLTMMLEPEITEDPKQALKLCEVYREVDQLFGLGGMYDAFFMEVYLRMGRYDDAAKSFSRYVDVLLGNVILPKDFLFAPALNTQNTRTASTKEMRRLLLRAVQEDERFRPLLQDARCAEAVERLKASVG